MQIQQTIKANIRDIVASALSLSRLTDFSYFPASSLTILTFHRVLPVELRATYPLPNLAVSPEELYWVLSNVKEHFEISTLSDAYQKSLQIDREKPQLAITFDDGQWDNLEYGLPVLEQLGMPATFYIPTAYIGGEKLLWHDMAAFAWQKLAGNRKEGLAANNFSTMPEQVFDSVGHFLQHLKKMSASARNDLITPLEQLGIEIPAWSRLMNWDEISHLHKLGHEIGSHARTHSLLSQLSTEEQHQELTQSRIDINNATGRSPCSICYPDGNYDDRTLDLLRESSYETAVTTQWGINRVISDRFQLLRFDINSDHLRNRKGKLSKSRFQFRLSRFHPKI